MKDKWIESQQTPISPESLKRLAEAFNLWHYWDKEQKKKQDKRKRGSWLKDYEKFYDEHTDGERSE